MGICPSSPLPRPSIGTHGGIGAHSNTSRAPPSVISSRICTLARVVHVVEGRMREYVPGVAAATVEAANPGYCLCGIENMHVGLRPPRVSEAEELQPGQIYFLLPEAKARRELALADLCELAVKACAAMQKGTGQEKMIGRGTRRKAGKVRSSSAALEESRSRRRAPQPAAKAG